MNKKIFLALIAVAVIAPVMSYAAGTNNACDVINAFKTIFEQVGSAVVIIGWIITGVLYLLAGGDPGKIKTAKAALVACVIGTAVIVLSVTAFTFVNSALNLGGTQGSQC